MATQNTEPWKKQSPRGEERPSMPQRKAMFLRRSSHPWMRQYPRDDMPRTKVTYPRGTMAAKQQQERHSNYEEANEGSLNPRSTINRERTRRWQERWQEPEEADESIHGRHSTTNREGTTESRKPSSIIRVPQCYRKIDHISTMKPRIDHRSYTNRPQQKCLWFLPRGQRSF